MKKILMTFFALFSLNLFGADAGWYTDYKQALQAAKEENKNVYLFIGADVCRFCDMYRDKTLSKKEPMDTLKKDYVPLYLSRDRDDIPEGFKTKGVPIHYFVHPDGKVFYSAQGYFEPDGFYFMLEAAELNL